MPSPGTSWARRLSFPLLAYLTLQLQRGITATAHGEPHRKGSTIECRASGSSIASKEPQKSLIQLTPAQLTEHLLLNDKAAGPRAAGPVDPPAAAQFHSRASSNVGAVVAVAATAAASPWPLPLGRALRGAASLVAVPPESLGRLRVLHPTSPENESVVHSETNSNPTQDDLKSFISLGVFRQLHVSIAGHNATSGPETGGPGPSQPTGLLFSKASCLGGLVYVVFVFAIAFIYTKSGLRLEAPEMGSPLKPPGIEDMPTRTFHFSMLDFEGCCGRDLNICLCSFCCLGIRWADTLSQSKLNFKVEFWTLLVFHAFCSVFDEVSLGVTSIVFVLVAVFYRQKLRTAFGLERNTVGTYAADCLIWTFCCPCAAVQEAREAEYLPVRAGATDGED